MLYTPIYTLLQVLYLYHFVSVLVILPYNLQRQGFITLSRAPTLCPIISWHKSFSGIIQKIVYLRRFPFKADFTDSSGSVAKIITTSPVCKISIIVHFRASLKNHLQHEKWMCQQVRFFGLVAFYVPSTARSFRDGTPIYCPLRRM